MAEKEQCEESGMKTYAVSGVEIVFPCKAYPSQLSMMDKIVRSLSRKQNCLLESPTGSGKSLALLCSCLAWQQKVKKEMEELTSRLQNNVIVSTVTPVASGPETVISPPVYSPPLVPCVSANKMQNFNGDNGQNNGVSTLPLATTEAVAQPVTPSTSAHKRQNSNANRRQLEYFDDDDFDFKPMKKYRSPRSSSCSSSKRSQRRENDSKQILDSSNSMITDSKQSPQSSSNMNFESKCNPQFGGNPHTKHAFSSHEASNMQTESKCSPQCASNNNTSGCSPLVNSLHVNSVSDQGFATSSVSGVCGEQHTNRNTPEPANPKINQPYTPCEAKVDIRTHPSPVPNNSIKSPDGKNEENSTFEVGKIPKIYFGTRTHKQIGQIIRELKKTWYKDVQMTVLSSRERTCIHREVSKMDNKNEGCEELLKRGPNDRIGCQFYKKATTVKHHDFRTLRSAWDLEDVVNMGRRARICPYYLCKNLKNDSDIIFCPYNYLIDPLIRSSLDITLKGSVVILDEAHNIEDSSRDAASLSVFQSEILEAKQDIELVAHHHKEHKELADKYNSIAVILSALSSWLAKSSEMLKPDFDSFEKSGKIWAGDEMLAMLVSIGAGPDDIGDIKKKFSDISQEESDTESENPKLSGKTMFLLKSILVILSFLYQDKLVHVPDYRCVVEKHVKIQRGSWRRRTNSPPSSDLKLSFWCLNPAVAFSDIKNNVHTLIVASGTLSPLSSFQSELNTPFSTTLEANHVISKSQVWVGTIGRGPTGVTLNATYHNTETFQFQDEVGSLLLKICTVIPHGVLCFLPSYSMLDKLVARWQMTGLWNEIETKKFIVCEPRGQHENFERSMREFYEVIQETEARSSDGIDGALFIAVCRGKVSEGLDFADNNARAVVTIGIPFPNIKDFQVNLKRKYNDSNCAKKSIMSGSEWYETQAFRALNQALGRCIRHKTDYGALIIVDERFQKYPRYVSSLSKWIRKELVHYGSFDVAASSLSEFSQTAGAVQPSN